MFAQGIGGAPKDGERAASLWDLACRGGEAAACTSLSEAAALKDESGLSLLYASKACAAGDVHGCTRLGVIAFVGAGTPKSTHRAQALWKHACEFEDPTACSYVGLLHLADEPEQARSTFRAQCDHDTQAGCPGFGLALELGLGGPPDFKEALRAYLEGCNAGRPSACVYAGLLIEENTHRPEHLRRAGQLYELGCAAPVTELCWIDEDQATRWQSHYAGESFARRACDGSSTRALACFNAGLAYERGSTGSVDVERAQELLDKSCGEGLSRACRSVNAYVVQ